MRASLTTVVAVVAVVATLDCGGGPSNDVDAAVDAVALPNMIRELWSSPGVCNGLVADEPTEFNLLLNAPGVDDAMAFDPRNFGHQIPAGGRLEIELGGTFERNGVDNNKPFVSTTNNRYLVLTTGPQNAVSEVQGIGVHHANYRIIDAGQRVLSILPNGGSGDNGLEGDRAAMTGVKVIHLRPVPNSNAGPSPFTNGPAGTDGTVEVRVYDANDNLIERGVISHTFPASVGRQIHVSNVSLTTPAPGDPNSTPELFEHTNFQHVAADTRLDGLVSSTPFSAGMPYAPWFLAFDDLANQPDSFTPQAGIADMGYVVNANDRTVADLVLDTNTSGLPDAGDTIIGSIVLAGPSAGQIIDKSVLTLSGDGITGPSGSIFTVPVQVGSATGVYTLTVAFDGGGEATNTIIVE